MQRKLLQRKDFQQRREFVADLAGQWDAAGHVMQHARGAHADVLHLGQDDLPLALARDIVGPDPLFGRSTHDEQQLAVSVTEDVDYFCVGPCWPTPTKPGRTAPGLELVRAAAATGTDKPWFAIGGIDLARVPEVVAAGARRIVVVRAITAAEDPAAAAQALKQALPTN